MVVVVVVNRKSHNRKPGSVMESKKGSRVNLDLDLLILKEIWECEIFVPIKFKAKQ